MSLAYSRSEQTMVSLSSESSSALASSPNTDNGTHKSTAAYISLFSSTVLVTCQIAALHLLAIYFYQLLHSSDQYSLKWLNTSIICCAISTVAGIAMSIAAFVLCVRHCQGKTIPRDGWLVIIIGSVIATISGN